MTGRRAPSVLAAFSLAGLALIGCSEDPMTAPGPGAGPGPTTPTVEAAVDVAAIQSWRDTTLVGFALPMESPFGLLATRPELRSRIIGRFDVPVETTLDTLLIERFVSGSVNVRVDTVRSEIPGFPVTIELYELARGFVAAEADWERPAEGEAWNDPGGDLGPLIATAQLEAEQDSVAIELPDPEDILERWQAEDGRPGFVLLVTEPDVRLRIPVVRLRFQAEVEDVAQPIPEVVPAGPVTFIYDPPQPAPGQPLRVGGVPAARFYLAFIPPDSVGGVPLRGSTINRAELRFHPLAPPPEPFALEREVSGRPVQLVTDPFEFGIKTPIGSAAPNVIRFDPDSLAAGLPIRIDVTPLLQLQAGELTDLDSPVRIGVRLEPDAQTLGYWEFGSAEAAPGLRPELRIILTPPPAFGTP